MSSSRFSVSNKTILITGASRGIGFALASGLAKEGAHVILAARSIETLKAAAESIGTVLGSITILALDVSNYDSIQHAFGQIDKIDVLINNAGTEEVCPSIELTEATWDQIIDTNLKGAFFCAQNAAKKMLEKKSGVIINICSLTSEVGVPTAVAYGSSKSGILGMTRALSAEWASKGVRVNGIGPGYFETDLTKTFYEDPDWCEQMLAKIPQQRFGVLDDLIGSAIFLSSDASKYITGQVIYVDGGYLASI